MHNDHTWALVLAAGEGSRLRGLTTTQAGVSVPKQFCSLRNGPSLLQEALLRAGELTSIERTCVVVAQQHRLWWERDLKSVPRQNIVVQPQNRGTANGILLPLLHILARDPQAQVVLLPSDHHVRDEQSFGASLRQAVRELSAHPQKIVLLGIEPDEPDPELGYILPVATDTGRLRQVERFIEKPPSALMHELIEDGALWNVFIVAARAQALLDVFAARFGQIVARMRRAVTADLQHPMMPVATAVLYESLPVLDFSRDLAQGSEAALRVFTVPACGWSDLGTPQRVVQTLSRCPADRHAGFATALLPTGFLNLELQAERLRAC